MMDDFGAVAGKPTATKATGVEWYYPAVTCEFGRPKRLPHGNRHETRGKAKRMIDEALKEQKDG